MKMGYFCIDCKVPLISNLCERCGKTIENPKIPLKASPVFKEELQMLKEATGEPLDIFDSLELWTANRYYYYEGRKIFKAVGGNMIEKPRIKWAQSKKRVLNKTEKNKKISEKEYFSRIKIANRFALGNLEEKSINFIKTVVERLQNKVVYKAVSFSGGKDSAVVSQLVRTALDNGVLHIFTDTTLENQDTLNYVKEFADAEKIFLLKAEPQLNFFELTEKALLPSRIHRWCCTAIKTVPIEKILKEILEPGQKILMFEGSRQEESPRRQKYEEIDLNSKIALQIIVRPILKWSTLEDWLYIFSKEIPTNLSYRYGMRRVGCSLCPFSSSWSEFIIKTRYPSLAKDYLDLLYKFAKHREIKKNITDYITNGGWKKRAGGSTEHLYYLDAEISDWKEDYKFVHIGLSKTIVLSALKEYIKPLINKYNLNSFESQIGEKIILILSKEQKAVCKIILEEESIDLWWFAEENRVYQQFLMDLKKQLIKYQFCSYCAGCETKCLSHAITIDAKNKKYTIENNKCIGCGECINIERFGCILAKSVKTSQAYKMRRPQILK